MSECSSKPLKDEGHILLIEAFYGGSHRQLVDLLKADISGCVTHTLPAKKWHWRARTAALWFAEQIPASTSYRVLFASSVLNLAELVALRPDLAKLKKILYFHENQLVYPVRKQQDRDFQYGYNQVLSSLVADEVVFNSKFNQDSFLSSIQSFLKLIPDHRPKGLREKILPKCRVLHFPISFPQVREEKQTPTEISLLDNTYDHDKHTIESIDGGVGNDLTKELSSNQLRDKKKGTPTDLSTTRVDISPVDNTYNQGKHTTESKEERVDNDLETELSLHQHVGDKELTPNVFAKDIIPEVNSQGHVRYTKEGEEERLGNVHETELSSNSLKGEKWTSNDNAKDVISELNSQDHVRYTKEDEGGSLGNDHHTELSSNKLRDKKWTLNDHAKDTIPDDDTHDQDKHSKELSHYQLAGDKELTPNGFETSRENRPLHIVWPHRWEHDKDPNLFFSTLFQLQEEGVDFHLSVLGELFTEVPDIFVEAKERLSPSIRNWGFLPSKADYYSVLLEADVVVSTAKHEFFGVAMLEAVHLGCHPVCPNQLVYPEIFPKKYLYNTPVQLYKMLRNHCRKPHLLRKQDIEVDTSQFSWTALKPRYEQLLSTDGIKEL